MVGSVHFIGESAVDHDDFDVWETAGEDAESIWTRYFEHLAARRPLRPLRHPRPPGPRQGLGRRPAAAGRATCAASTSPPSRRSPSPGVAVEVSTAGLRKPVGEIYPARAFAELCVEAGAPFALSSDAHLPEHVGFAYDEALEFMRSLGIDEISVFEGRERRMEPLG